MKTYEGTTLFEQWTARSLAVRVIPEVAFTRKWRDLLIHVRRAPLGMAIRFRSAPPPEGEDDPDTFVTLNVPTLLQWDNWNRNERKYIARASRLHGGDGTTMRLFEPVCATYNAQLDLYGWLHEQLTEHHADDVAAVNELISEHRALQQNPPRRGR